MNIETYIFGQFPSGYHQSPEDYTQSIFQALAQHSTAVTQLATYRKGNLMYYGYIRRLEGNHYIGLCAVLNGWYVKHPTELFAGFEGIIERLVNDKTLIDYREGQVRALLTTSLALGKQSTLVRKILTSIFESQEIAPLPAVSYGTSDDAVKRYNIDSNLEAIEASVYTQAYTIIAKHEGYDTFLQAYQKESNPKTAVNTEEKSVNSKDRWWYAIIPIAMLLVIVSSLLREAQRKSQESAVDRTYNYYDYTGVDTAVVAVDSTAAVASDYYDDATERESATSSDYSGYYDDATTVGDSATYAY